MKNSGIIVGMLPLSGSLYNINNSDSKCEIWKGNAEYDDSAENIIKFTYHGVDHIIKLNKEKRIISSEKSMKRMSIAQRCFFINIQVKNGIVFRGDFIENNNTFDCFIELRPIK
jgi:hypothetical protein